MPLPTIAGVLRISVGGNCDGGGRWANTWHARNDSLIDFTQASIQAFHDIFSQFYVGAAISTGSAVFRAIGAGTNIDDFAYTPLDGSSGAYHYSTNVAGNAGGFAMPAEVAEVITIRTAERGRQNRGRVYLPPWTVAGFILGGKLHPAVINETLQQLADVEAGIETGGAHLGVASYGRSVSRTGVVRTWTPHFTPVQQFTMDNVADVQRRRKT